MKVHISRVHHVQDQVKVEQKTTDCKKTVMGNKGFLKEELPLPVQPILPLLFLVTVVPDAPTVISTVLSLSDEILLSDNIYFYVVELSSPSSLPVQKISLGDYRLRDKTDSALTDVRKISNCSSSSGIKSTVEESSHQ